MNDTKLSEAVKDWLTHCDKYRDALFASIDAEKVNAACTIMQSKEAVIRELLGMPAAVFQRQWGAQ